MDLSAVKNLDSDPVAANDAVRRLRRDVIGAGFLDRTPWFYSRMLTCSYALLALGIAIAIWSPDALVGVLLAAVVLAFAIDQIALVGHDAGHMAVFRRAQDNHLLGLICWSLTAGVGFWYWCDRHNRHHANTNDLEDDPDLGWTALIAHDETVARARTGWLRAITPYQAFIAAAAVPLVAFGFRIESYAFALRQLHGSRRVIEMALLATNVVVWIAAMTWLGWRGVALFLVTQAAAGMYLSFIIAPNHKGMPMWAHGTPLSFVERQVLSSRNLSPGPVWDIIFGGLNYQIEHHLFPQMPRPHLRRATALVRPFCESAGLSYEVAHPVSAFTDIFIRAHRIGRTVKRPAPAAIADHIQRD